MCMRGLLHLYIRKHFQAAELGMDAWAMVKFVAWVCYNASGQKTCYMDSVNGAN